MNKRDRLDFFKKIAQTVPDLPTADAVTKILVSGSPPSFIAPDHYPSMILAFQAKNIPIINGLTDLLNTCLFYSSGGKVNLSWMRSSNFNFDTSGIPSVDLRNLMVFSKQIYNTLFTNNGIADQAQLSPEQIKERVEKLQSSSSLEALSSFNPKGQLGTKVSGNIKTLIKNYLLNIK